MKVFIVNSYITPLYKIDRISINTCFSTREKAEWYLEAIVPDGDIQELEIDGYDYNTPYIYYITAMRACNNDSDLNLPANEFIKSLVFDIELLSLSDIEPKLNAVRCYLPPGGSKNYYDPFIAYYSVSVKSKIKLIALEIGTKLIKEAITNQAFEPEE